MTRRLLSFFLRWFFKHLYTTFAWAYDIVAWVVSLGRWREWVLAATADIELREAFEVGFGPGHLQLHLARKGIDRLGIDPSKQMSRLAGRRLAKAGYPSNLIRGRSQEMPLRSRSLSTILSTFPSEFIYDPVSLSELKRILKPEGEIVIVAMARITGKAFLDRIMAAVFRFSGQTREFPENWEACFQKIGFDPKVEELESKNSVVYRIRCTKLGSIAPAVEDT